MRAITQSACWANRKSPENARLERVAKRLDLRRVPLLDQPPRPLIIMTAVVAAVAEDVELRKVAGALQPDLLQDAGEVFVQGLVAPDEIDGDLAVRRVE